MNKIFNNFEVKAIEKKSKYDIVLLDLQQHYFKNRDMIKYYGIANYEGIEIYFISPFVGSSVYNLELCSESIDKLIYNFKNLNNCETLEWDHFEWLNYAIKRKYSNDLKESNDLDLLEEFGNRAFEDLIKRYATSLYKQNEFKNNFMKLYDYCLKNFITEEASKYEVDENSMFYIELRLK